MSRKKVVGDGEVNLNARVKFQLGDTSGGSRDQGHVDLPKDV